MTHKPLRDCQIKAIATFNENREKGEVETNLSLCTGAGKSNIIREITGKNVKEVIVFPWLALVQQFWKDHKDNYSNRIVRYLATEGTLDGVARLSDSREELNNTSYTILTTYTSAPLLFESLPETYELDLLVHDEAHRTERPQYKGSLKKILSKIKHIANLSATLPQTKKIHFRYPLLRGIKDKVVRDFHMELFMCVKKERTDTSLIITIIKKLITLHKKVKLLVYTAEANTEEETSSSVKTFLQQHEKGLKEQGWWVKGITDEIKPKDRQPILRDFEKNRDVSILVSCKTLSEGVDLMNGNCILPWDPSASIIDNIQRIGRVLRLYRNSDGTPAKEQTPSTVLIPIFLEEEKYLACGGDREKINELLCQEIAEGERGNFRPIVNVCTALKEELAEDDIELFNRLLNYPLEPKVAVDKNLVEVVAKACKKDSEKVLEEVAEALADKVDEEELEEILEGEWSEELNGEVANALAQTQGITLVVKDGEEADIFGSGENTVTVEKREGEDGYKLVKEKKAVTADKEAAKKRIAQRMRIDFSDECKIILGLDSIEGADNVGGMVLTRLTTEVKLDEDWEKRRLEWVAMYEKLGFTPPISSKEKQVKKVAQWQFQQRHFYKFKKTILTEERIYKLENTKGWKWEQEDKWEPQRQNWISIYKKLGRTPVVLSKDKEEKKAGVWQTNQRKLYKKKDICMTLERIKILEDTPGWKWDDDNWEFNYKHWVSVYKNIGETPTKHSSNIDEKKAGHWQSNQRNEYYKNNLSIERISILESTTGWKWNENDNWENNRLHWVNMYNKLGKFSQHSNDPEEKKAATWQSHQRKYYKKKDNWMTSERISSLNNTPGWKWDENDNWEENRQKWIAIYIKLGGNPSQTSKDIEEKKAGKWQSHQRENYKKKEKSMTPERIAALEATPGWTWSADEPPKTPYVPEETQEQTPLTQEQPKPAERKRKPLVLKAEQKPKENSQQRPLSILESYHKKFKNMNAATFKNSTTEEEWLNYHEVAAVHEERDKPEAKPINKIAALLTKFNKPPYNTIDLGCGMNELRSHELVSKMKWTSVDIHAADESVLLADMSALPFDEETYDFAVMSRSLWARNHRDVLKEVYRILKSGGRLVICEAFRRWMEEKEGKFENTLLHSLKEVGFEVVWEEGTSATDVQGDVWQYVMVRKG